MSVQYGIMTLLVLIIIAQILLHKKHVKEAARSYGNLHERWKQDHIEMFTHQMENKHLKAEIDRKNTHIKKQKEVIKTHQKIFRHLKDVENQGLTAAQITQKQQEAEMANMLRALNKY